MKVRFFALLVLASLFYMNNISYSQDLEKDTVTTKNTSKDSTDWLKEDASVKQKKHSPTRATLYSTVLPGLGQVYNHQYWKIPIIAGLGVFFVTSISSNNHDYQNAKNDYRIRLQNENDQVYKDDRLNKTHLFDPSKYDAYDENNPENKANNVRTYSTSQLRLTRDGYRRDRDFFVIMSAVVYALNIVDAAVFAHLREFEVSEKLSMRIDPDLRLVNNTSATAGVTCRLYFRK